jgi:hypothetical protein
MKILSVLLLSLTTFAVTAVSQTPAASPEGVTAKSPSEAKAGAPAVSAVLVLRTSLTSKNATEGKEVMAVLEKSVVLPGGQNLPRATLLRGRVVQVSRHSKDKPNGALLLVFDEARPKDGPHVPVLIQIQQLAPSAAAENNLQKMPGARLGGTSNSGGTQQLEFENAEHSTLTSNNKQSDIDGVYLRNTAGGSGTIFSLGEDVYLDSDIRMTVLIAQGPPKPE